MLLAFCIRYSATHVPAFSYVMHLVPEGPTSKLDLMRSVSSTLALSIEKCNASESAPWLCFVLENSGIALFQCINVIDVPILKSDTSTLAHPSISIDLKGFV